jgi:hypothetical protein
MRKHQKTQAQITITNKETNSKEQKAIRSMFKESPEASIAREESECLKKMFK